MRRIPAYDVQDAAGSDRPCKAAAIGLKTIEHSRMPEFEGNELKQIALLDRPEEWKLLRRLGQSRGAGGGEGEIGWRIHPKRMPAGLISRERNPAIRSEIVFAQSCWLEMMPSRAHAKHPSL